MAHTCVRQVGVFAKGQQSMLDRCRGAHHVLVVFSLKMTMSITKWAVQQLSLLPIAAQGDGTSLDSAS